MLLWWASKQCMGHWWIKKNSVTITTTTKRSKYAPCPCVIKARFDKDTQDFLSSVWSTECKSRWAQFKRHRRKKSALCSCISQLKKLVPKNDSLVWIQRHTVGNDKMVHFTPQNDVRTVKHNLRCPLQTHHSWGTAQWLHSNKEKNIKKLMPQELRKAQW